jgi:2,4-dienoyl-CoA reductase-like NADH-dependent reductase (Old Yellow Enzyme family)
MVQTSANAIAQPLTLKNGQVIKNRIFKSAMSETLGTVDNRMTPALINLYDCWAKGGSGLLVSGNVMIDRRYLGEPYNLAIEDERDLPMLKELAKAGTQNGSQFWVQLNHPGKQTMRTLTKEPIAPSAIAFRPEMQRFFATPRAMTEAEILDAIARFGKAAAVCKKAGFTGVQIHAAHGYLISQFLSGHHNQRTDQWGGNAENRRRFVLEVYKAIRAQVGEDFAVGIKLNSADFQRGGFSEDESIELIRALSQAGIDLIEISGGTYEAPAMALKKYSQKQSTREREAYFLDFAEKARAITSVPLVVTGGFRTLAGMNQALASGALDMIGLGRLLAIEPDAPLRLVQGQDPAQQVKPISTGIKAVDKMALMEIMWYARQMHRLAHGKKTKPNESGLMSLLHNLWANGLGTLKTQKLRAS